MFTGIVEEIGSISKIEPVGALKRFSVVAPICCTDLKIGDSIALNGVCLTVASIDAGEFSVEAVPQTLGLTNLNQLIAGSKVNLERAMPANGRFGGHLVQGHVDACVAILEIKNDAQGTRLSFALPENLSRYVVKKGYVALDGMSLTVVDVLGDNFSIALIPHTCAVTIAQYYEVGRAVNLEVDIVGKYLEKHIGQRGSPGQVA